jgi:hypothetical protein
VARPEVNPEYASGSYVHKARQQTQGGDSVKVSNKGKAHQLVASQEELLQKLRAELSASKQDSLIVMAGHFMLFVDDESGRLVPGIMEEQSSDDMRNRIARRVGIFPRYTWDLSVELAEDFRGKFDSINILLLINDWQYVPANGVSPSQLRRDFYEQFTGLPDSYRARLERSAWLSSENVLRQVPYQVRGDVVGHTNPAL